jgi:hypothetical protein
MTATHIPIIFCDDASRRSIATHWFRPDAATGEVWDEIEVAAERIAKREGVTVDICVGHWDESGAVVGHDRAGIRVSA